MSSWKWEPFRWKPPRHWIRVETVEAHAGGEPLRVILKGFPQPRGKSMLQRRRDAIRRLDHLRRALMWEPRGHADMYGCLLTPPVSPEADVGILFLHNEGYSTMCGHGIIAATTVLLETGVLPFLEGKRQICFDTPAGLIRATARQKGGRVISVRFRNVPSFVLERGGEVEVPGLGLVPYDLAFGGAFYAYVEAPRLGLGCSAKNARSLIQAGVAIKQALQENRSISHPLDPELGFLYGTVFVDQSPSDGVHSRHACVFAEGELDRSPTGTGVSGRAAILFQQGEMRRGEELTIESIIGSRFRVRIVEEVSVGPYEGIVPEVEGSAHITGRCQFLLDPRDPFRHGFFLR